MFRAGDLVRYGRQRGERGGHQGPARVKRRGGRLAVRERGDDSAVIQDSVDSTLAYATRGSAGGGKQAETSPRARGGGPRGLRGRGGRPCRPRPPGRRPAAPAAG